MQSQKIIVAAVAAVALSVVWAVPAAGAISLSDVNLDSIDATSLKAQTVADESAADAMPDNPDAALPDEVSGKIADDATVVSEDHALTADGKLKDIETGATVTDPELVGTTATQPDPLAKTDGESFIPVDAKEVKDKVAANGGSADGNANAASAQSAQSTIRLAALGSNEYGAHWGTYNGTPAFFERSNNLFVQQAKGVVDVSQWQGTIDWQAAKNAGVEGAIIRLSYGWGNGFDQQARRNISECKRLGIPFGVYIYSYAYDANTGAAEGNDVVSLLRQAGVNPGDLSYPVYYDLEAWSWSGHAHPTSPSVYDGIVNAWYGRLQAAGYNNLSVYSYTSYLNGPLNSGNIHSKTRWVAQYGASMQYTAFPTNDRGWQYTSSGRVNGISGNVDLNAFGNRNYAASIDVRRMARIEIPNGTYYINAFAKDSSSLDIPGASTAQGARTQLYAANHSKGQQFRFTKQSDGSYVIVNVNSGKALDVSGASAFNKAVVQQYDSNGSAAQRWFIRDSGGSYYLQSALGNWVLDISGGSTADGTAVTLYEPNGSAAQLFALASVNADIPTDGPVSIASAVNAHMVMDITSGSKDDRAKVQVYGWNATDAQLYRFTEVGNRVYRITSVLSGKVLDVASGSTANGAALQQYHSNDTQAQHWTVRNYGNGRYAFVSVKAGKAIDVPGANASARVKLQTYASNGTNAQLWTLSRQKTVRQRLNERANSNRGVLADGIHTFISAIRNSTALDVSGGSSANSANVQSYASNGTNAQRWRVTHDAQGYITLRNVGSGKVLDVAGASLDVGANVQQYQSNGTYAQKWIAVKNRDGSITLESALADDRVLDVSGASAANGANVQIYTSNGTNAQRWRVR